VQNVISDDLITAVTNHHVVVGQLAVGRRGYGDDTVLRSTMERECPSLCISFEPVDLGFPYALEWKNACFARDSATTNGDHPRGEKRTYGPEGA
jgi:hypothetical protein